MKPASAGSPKGRDANAARSRSDDIAVRAADAPALTRTPPMPTEQLEVSQRALIDEIISMYHTTRLSETPVAVHILSKPSVKKAFARFEREILDTRPGEGWRSIGSAPTDGTVFLARNADHHSFGVWPMMRRVRHVVEGGEFRCIDLGAWLIVGDIEPDYLEGNDTVEPVTVPFSIASDECNKSVRYEWRPLDKSASTPTASDTASPSASISSEDRVAIAKAYLSVWYDWPDNPEEWWASMSADERARGLRAADAVISLASTTSQSDVIEKCALREALLAIKYEASEGKLGKRSIPLDTIITIASGALASKEGQL